MRDEARSPGIASAKSDVKSEPLANGVHPGGHSFEGGIFKRTPEARFALVEMRVQIKEQGLNLEAAIDLVVRRTQEITRSCGVAVGLLQKDGVVYPSRTGVATTVATLHFQDNLFQSCLRTGRALQLRDAQNHPLLGAICREEGIGSLIIMPLFHNREVAGAIEFLFAERRSFSIGDVMDLELIAGIISESLSGTEQMGSQPAEAFTSLPRTGPVESIESQARDSLPGDSVKEKDSSVYERPSNSFGDTTGERGLLMMSSTWESLTPESICSPPTSLPRRRSGLPLRQPG